MKSRLTWTTLRLCTVLGLFLGAGSGRGIDFTAWARHLRQHQAWTSLDFRDPNTGMFLAARAGTEDPKAQATLTFTAMPAQACRPDAVLVLKAAAPARRDSETLGEIRVHWDGLGRQSFRGLIVRQGGDPFVFARILDGFSPDILREHRTLRVALPDGGSAAFSLEGFESAWSMALETCRAFLGPGRGR